MHAITGGNVTDGSGRPGNRLCIHYTAWFDANNQREPPTFAPSPTHPDLSHRTVKKRFFCYFFIFVTFLTFLFSKRFLFKKNAGKVQSGKQINKKHFQNNTNEIRK